MAMIPTVRQHKAMLADQWLCRRAIAKEGIFKSYYPTVRLLIDVGCFKRHVAEKPAEDSEERFTFVMSQVTDEDEV